VGHGTHFSIRAGGGNTDPWCPLFDPCQKRKHWTGVTMVLVLQISKRNFTTGQNIDFQFPWCDSLSYLSNEAKSQRF
jgi:hypothetical protein